jgi:hypothetical protein
MPEYHIAQINIARMLAPITDPIMVEFVAQLAPINALADQSSGFVWRLQSENGDATSIRVYDDDFIIVNLTVWESVDALREYVYKSAHQGVLRDRKRWFEKFDGPYMLCGGYPLGIFLVPKKAKNGWTIYVSMGRRLMRSPLRMFSQNLQSEKNTFPLSFTS